MPSFLAGRLRAPSPPSPSAAPGGACGGGAGGGLGSSCWGRMGRRVPRIGRENSLTGVLHLPEFGKGLIGRDPNPSEGPGYGFESKGFVIFRLGAGWDVNLLGL